MAMIDLPDLEPGPLMSLPRFDMTPLQATISVVGSTMRFSSVEGLKDALTQVYEHVLTLGQAKAVEEPAPPQEPAVPIRKSVTDDFIICLEDGKKFKSLKRHIQAHYGLTPEQYREKWKLPADYPMVAKNYSEHRSRLAKENGLGKKG